MENKNIFIKDSFIFNNKKKLIILENVNREFKYKNEIKNNMNTNYHKKNLNNIKDITLTSSFNSQEFVLDMLLELRDFDEKNGTDLFKNIIYKDLNNFILKNKI